MKTNIKSNGSNPLLIGITHTAPCSITHLQGRVFGNGQNKSMAERINRKHHAARVIKANNYNDWSICPAPFVDHTDKIIMLESLLGT